MVDLYPVAKRQIELAEKILTDKSVPIPTLLIGTKVDLFSDGDWGRTDEEMEDYCKEHNYIGFIKTSARNGVNIEESIKFIIKYVLDNNIQPAPIGGADPPPMVKVGKDEAEETQKKGCC